MGEGGSRPGGENGRPAAPAAVDPVRGVWDEMAGGGNEVPIPAQASHTHLEEGGQVIGLVCLDERDGSHTRRISRRANRTLRNAGRSQRLSLVITLK